MVTMHVCVECALWWKWVRKIFFVGSFTTDRKVLMTSMTLDMHQFVFSSFHFGNRNIGCMMLNIHTCLFPTRCLLPFSKTSYLKVLQTGLFGGSRNNLLYEFLQRTLNRKKKNSNRDEKNWWKEEAMKQ